MGYEYFYQNIAEWLLLSMLISIDSLLQILILDIFFNFFYQYSTNSPKSGEMNVVVTVWVCCHIPIHNCLTA